MKKIFGYLIVGAISFFGGVAVGYEARKKTAEVTFEEITPEEQARQIAQDDPIRRPEDIQKAIDRMFDKKVGDAQGDLGKSAELARECGANDKDIQHNEAEVDRLFTKGAPRKDIPDRVSGGDADGDSATINGLDTQKIQYMKQWKAAEKYDTRTKETPKNVVTTDEDEDDDLEAGIDHELLNEMIGGSQRVKGGPDIEAGTMEDWDHWLGIQDGDYDPVEIWWYDEDNVLTDEKNQPLENPGKYLGFDVARKFQEIDADMTGDDDIRVIYNHSEGAIFQIIRKHASYDRLKAMEEYGDDGQDDPREWIRSRRE